MKHILIIITVLLLFASCREIYQIRNATRVGTQVAAGKVTSYVNEYTFYQDSIVADNHLLAIEKYMQFENWTISQENEWMANYEFSSSPVSQSTTSKMQNGTANFKVDSVNNHITLLLRLRGNYNFGTKEKSLAFYQDLKTYLYGIEVDKKDKKKLKSN